MATNSKKNSKIKPAKKKNPVKNKSASKAGSKTVKKTVPKTAQKSAKPKSPVKPAVKPVTIAKAPQKQIQTDKKATEAGKAFEKKIDEMAQKSASIQKTVDKPKSFFKAAVAVIIIIVIAIIVYIFYPGKKSSVMKEEMTPKEPVSPAPEARVMEPREEAAKPRSEDVSLYTVKYQDQLTKISEQQYGTYKEWKRIYEANKDKIKNPNLIFPGQEFIIPKIEKTEK